MKKIQLIFCTALWVCMLFPAFANAQFKYGIKAGMNLNSIHFNKDRLSPDSKVGYQVGPTMELMFPAFNLGCDLSLLFSQRGMAYNNKDYTNNYIEIPLNLKWKANLPIGKLFVAAGPYYAFCVGDKEWSIPQSSTQGNVNLAVTARNDIGVNVGAGVEFLRYFAVGIGYRYGLSDAYEVAKSNKSYAQNRSFEMNVGFLF